VKSSEDDHFKADKRAKFAADVIKLYDAALNGQLDACTESSLEVRQVAFGLVALRQALDPHLEKHRNNPLRLAAAGALEAVAILDALTSGRDHPVWMHIDALKSARYRPGAAPPGEQEQKRRAMLAGAVLAYKKAAAVSSIRKAAEAVCEGIRSNDFPFSPDQLRQWTRRNDGGPHAKQFLEDAANVSDCAGERVLVVARQALHALLSVPAIKAD
jgi:hypothetical protein